ncbi:MAG: ABC transporter permease [Phocaeicola sp.]|nr:ABC transporter permease [Phocaeicola sp.]
MNWKLFIARRIYRSSGKSGREATNPAIRIAMAGIAIGLAVMIVSVAVVVGFKNQVRDKVVGLASEVIITSLDDAQLYMTQPVAASDSLLDALTNKEGVEHAQRFTTKPGMIMTDDNFQGMILKGVGQEYDMDYLINHLLEGEIPQFADTASTGKVIISKSISDKLHIKTGDKIYTYFVDDNIRARRLTVSGIYQTNFSAFDDFFLLTDIYTVNRLNGWKPDQVSGIELDVKDYSQIDNVNDEIRSDILEYTDKYGQNYFSRTIVEANPQIFAWLDLLDLNVWVILILMTGVAGFTMISGLLIIILERTNMIGVLKAMGADNTSIREIFLSFSVFLIGRGMLWGNVIGVSLCLIQFFFEPFKLDPTIYYLSSVPVELNIFYYILLNVFTLLVSVLMLIGPSYLISRIHPAKSIKFE